MFFLKEEAITKADAFEAGENDYLVKLPDKIELIARIRYHSKGYIALLERNEMYQALLESKEALAHELNRAAEYVISLLPTPLKKVLCFLNGRSRLRLIWRRLFGVITGLTVNILQFTCLMLLLRSRSRTSFGFRTKCSQKPDTSTHRFS